MSSSISASRADIDALLATISNDEAALTAEVSIVPPISTERARERIEAMLANSSRITLGDSLGEGGRGIVRAAEQLGLRRDVAVKKVRGEVTDRGLVELLQEAMITGSLEHPNIVPVHYIGVDDDGEPYIVLKKIEGESWDELAGERSLEDNLEILLDVINAIRFAHSRGIVHRDLKPANVMVGEFGEVYVLDWGLAVSLDDEHQWLPRASDVRGVAGTLAYMAPEMLRGEGISERTDIYLLGAILCELATGRPPHRGSIVAKLIESVETSRPDLDGVPAELAAIIRKAMCADPAGRYASADELKAAIEDFLVHRDAARLADNAAGRLDVLLDAIEDEADRDAVYNLFGECRFGFREALRRWPGALEARAGLERAVIAMAEHELERGEAVAAQRLLSELEDAPPKLAGQIESAIAESRKKLASLERLEADLDPSVARGWRTVAAIALGVVAIVAFAYAPLVTPETVSAPTWALFFAVTGGAGVALGIVGIVLRRPLLSSRPNRMFAFGVVVAWIATMTAIGALWYSGAEPLGFSIFHPVIWFSVFAMLAASVDRRLWPGAVIFLATIAVVPSLNPMAARWALVISLVLMVVVVGKVSMCIKREQAACALRTRRRATADE